MSLLRVGATPALAADYFVDPSPNGCGGGCSDTNDGRSRRTAWATLPGTMTLDGSRFLQSAWGQVSTSNQIRAGDTIHLRGGQRQSAGPIDICNGLRCVGGGLNPGFYENASAERPIRIKVDPSWGNGPFTFDFANATASFWTGALMAIRADYVWLQGAGQTRRIRVTGCRAANAYSLLGLEGRRDAASFTRSQAFLRGAVLEWVEVDGSANTSACHGINVATADGYLIANTVSHHSQVSSDDYGLVAGNLNDYETTGGMIVDSRFHDNANGGMFLTNARDTYIVRTKAYHNGLVNAGADRRGLDAGSINGSGFTNLSVLDSEFWGNGSFNWGFSACGDSEHDCAPQHQIVVAHTIGHSESNGSGGAYCYGGARCIHRNVTLYGYEEPIKLGGDYNNAQRDVDGNLAGTHFEITNTILYPSAGSNITCYAADSAHPITITSGGGNLIVPSPGGSDDNGMTRVNGSGTACSTDYTYKEAVSWLAPSDARGTAHRPQFHDADPSQYSQDKADYRLEPGSPGVDAGEWYCRITSASGSGRCFDVDCDPTQYFYQADEYPGAVLAEDRAYIGTGSDDVCRVATLSRPASLGGPGSICCTSPVGWDRRDGVMRVPVLGRAPVVGAVGASGESLSKAELKCRETIAKSGGKLAWTAAGELAACHKKRSAGRLPATTDCDVASEAGSAGRLRRLGDRLRAQAQAKCGALAPAGLGYAVCPPPCQFVGPELGAFADVAECLICLTEMTVEDMSAAAQGSPVVPLGEAEQSCHAEVGRRQVRHLTTALKEGFKCQKRGPAAAVVDTSSCALADSRGKIAKARANGAAAIGRACEAAALDRVDSCDELSIESLNECLFDDSHTRGQEVLAFLWGLPGG